MDRARAILALIVLVSYPPAIAFWFLVHPFIDFWRRVGPVRTYTVAFTGMLLMGAVLFALRGPLLSVEFGTNRLLVAAAVAMYLSSLVVEAECRRYLRLPTLFGLPELRGDGSSQALLQEGIYARVRHPRYLGVLLGGTALALFTNYLAVYVVAILSVAGIYGITILEERELVRRFGERYEQYRERVPRLFPRIGRGRP